MKMKCAIIMYPPFSSDGVGRLGSQNNSNWPRKVCFFLTVLQDSNKLNCISVFSTVSVSCSEYILFIFSRNFPILAWFDCSDRRSRRQYIGELFRKIYLGHFTLPRLNFLRFLPLPPSLSLSLGDNFSRKNCLWKWAPWLQSARGACIPSSDSAAHNALCNPVNDGKETNSSGSQHVSPSNIRRGCEQRWRWLGTKLGME